MLGAETIVDESVTSLRFNRSGSTIPAVNGQLAGKDGS